MNNLKERHDQCMMAYKKLLIKYAESEDWTSFVACEVHIDSVLNYAHCMDIITFHEKQIYENMFNEVIKKLEIEYGAP